ncbi:hypothetical protein EXIGLDRAFT_716025 [Exidia glandulosa HHB12029]|uniref:ARM repeat-containing protein n=1 Tax=Exidia glandulosa HHB12029 TaxID=1314781 RepID=A0A165QSA3_EXIGL|nr:hypothetical protein EXIGLDRAFT_716025 [Exidia glandulosa HHB12029]
MLDDHLDALQVPAPFASYDADSSDVIAATARFSIAADTHLNAVRHADALGGTLSVADQARIVATVAPFDADEPWVSESNHATAKEILDVFAPPGVALIQEILLNHVRPAFAKTPHPAVNLATGRKLARPIGGVGATHDLYDEQTWKKHPGIPAIVHWCTTNIETTEYEQLWHLIVPPLMTLLDDYETRYKIWGVRIATAMLQRAPAALLHRSGIDSLLDKSIVSTFYHLHNPETADLLRISIPGYIALVERCTELDSMDRLNKLFDLMGNNIIGSIWIYASRDADTILATTDVLPDVVQALGISTCRYLKALIPQLLYSLTAEYAFSARQALSSLTALECVLRVCRPRVKAWAEVILTSICRCWVSCIEDTHREKSEDIQTHLVSLLGVLVDIDPVLRQNEIPQIYTAQRDLFHGLFESFIVT